ncbi:mitochondrial ribosomal protein 10 [Parathielavia hyrcaniae]|uniref:Small ribosomal subunit protein mS37 n=1 Tax=Parathielavia hyrcaniae TaxID=113614 RepID=A0AAN6T225_9PEZI|nr:mitochondrial ribosomal protein 10 [Parathielavia hyrcaniae]
MTQKPIRLPPLRSLRVRQPNRHEPNPCLTIMSSVLACWASAGYQGRGCTTVEQALRTCMDAPPAPAKGSNTINYHLARFSKRLISQGKKK